MADAFMTIDQRLSIIERDLKVLSEPYIANKGRFSTLKTIVWIAAVCLASAQLWDLITPII